MKTDTLLMKVKVKVAVIAHFLRPGWFITIEKLTMQMRRHIM